MADARATRFTMEVLASAPVAGKVTRQGIQVAMDRPGANTSAEMTVTRFTMEVLAEFPDRAQVTRQGIQVALDRPGANSTAEMAVTRHTQEVLAQTPPKAAVTRQGIQAALARPGANLNATMEVTRHTQEVLARSFIPMTSFGAPAGWELFLHNWARKCRLESAYRTALSSSAEEVSEERTALIVKPYRTIDFQWAIKGNDETNDMLVEFRRVMDETSIVPLYMHAVDLTQDAASASNELYGDFSRGRYNVDGPVVIVQLSHTRNDPNTRVLDWELRNIEARFDEKIVLTSGLSQNFPKSTTVVMPLMKVHPQSELEYTLLTNNTIRIDAEFEEIYGDTALPPSFTDLPPGYDSYDEIPILSTSPDWQSGLVQRLKREGSRDALGRGKVIYQRGARHRQIHELLFRESGDIAWDLIRFFDTRRGRLLPFWVIDFENVHNVALISNPFVTVSSSIGTLADFQAERDYIGLIMSDGRAIVRRTTAIVENLGAWRITIDENIPAGYDHTDVVAFGRARLCRMQSDALTEEWDTTNVCQMRIPVIELMEEGEVTP